MNQRSSSKTPSLESDSIPIGFPQTRRPDSIQSFHCAFIFGSAVSIGHRCARFWASFCVTTSTKSYSLPNEYSESLRFDGVSFDRAGFEASRVD